MAAVLDRESVTVRPTGEALGADIEGIDLSRQLSADIVDEIREVWGDHLVLRFRGQKLDDDQLMRFSAHFGELDLAPVIAAARVKTPTDRSGSGRGGTRYVSVISTSSRTARRSGALGAYESIWHTDMSYNREPPCASALYALEVRVERRHGFANMYRAYETCPKLCAGR